MKFLGIAWTALWEIFIFFVILNLFSSSYDPFEIHVYALLVLILTAVGSFRNRWAITTLKTALRTMHTVEGKSEAELKEEMDAVRKEEWKIISFDVLHVLYSIVAFWNLIFV